MSYTNEDLYTQQANIARDSARQHAQSMALQGAMLAQARAQHEQLMAQQVAAQSQQAQHNYSMWVQTPDGRYYDQWRAAADRVLDLSIGAETLMREALAQDAARVLSAADFNVWRSAEPWSPASAAAHGSLIRKAFLRAMRWTAIPSFFFVALPLWIEDSGFVGGVLGLVFAAAILALPFALLRKRKLENIDRVMRALVATLKIERHDVVAWAASPERAYGYLRALMTVTDNAFTTHPRPESLPAIVLPELRSVSEMPAGSALEQALARIEGSWRL